MSSHFDNIFREGLICIILGAIFEMHFEVAMNSAKDIVENNIRLAVHMSQIELRLGFGQIIEFQILNDTCPLTFTNEDKCNEDKCINADDDECCCMNLLADDAYSGGIYGISGISMDIPEISMFQDPAIHCHQIRRHTLNFK